MWEGVVVSERIMVKVIWYGGGCLRMSTKSKRNDKRGRNMEEKGKRHCDVSLKVNSQILAIQKWRHTSQLLQKRYYFYEVFIFRKTFSHHPENLLPVSILQ